MKFDVLNKIAASGKSTAKMPVLFLGHGSPINAIEENEFVKGFRKVFAEIEKPKARLFSYLFPRLSIICYMCWR